MPMYNYECTSCEVVFDEFVSMEYYKEPQEHAECGNLCYRTAEGQTFNAHGIGLKERYTEGRQKQTEKAWMEQEVENTSEALKGETGASPYSKMSMNIDVLEKQGRCKKVSQKDAHARKKSAEKLNQDAAKNLSAEDVEIVTRPDRARSK